jgi:putative endonuclease
MLKSFILYQKNEKMKTIHMSQYCKKIGKLGENLAIRFLRDKGYQILEKNVYFRSGEIDLLTKHKGKIVFFEIKTRTNKKFGYPEESLNKKKMAKISQAINNYLFEHPEISNWQADCLSITYEFS